MYSVGMKVPNEFVITAPASHWVKIDDIHCPHCGKMSGIYFILKPCNPAYELGYYQIHELMICTECTYLGNMPDGWCADKDKNSSWWKMHSEIIESLKLHQDESGIKGR